MGVRGLNKFMEENPQVFKPFELHNTRLVIDGCSLIHYMYTYSGADQRFGGDYNEYVKAVRKFFATFKECNITPIVVFDGGYTHSDRKLANSVNRHENRLQNITDLIRTGECWSTIMPINAYEIFKDILLEMCITFAQCDYEGDKQIATLAKCYECPVLSDDSDFYIYDLPHGFIKLTNISTQIVTGKGKNGATRNFLTCKIYYVGSFLANFPLREMSVLSLLAVLAGNDYSTYEDFKYFYYKNKIRNKTRFYSLLAWLRRRTLEQAMNQVLQFISNGKKNEIRTMIEDSLEDYELKHTNLVDILAGISSNMDKNIIHATKLAAPCGKSFPKEFVTAFHRGYLPSTLLNIINMHWRYLPPQVENFSNVSSYFCSRYIRQVLYGILLSHDPSNSKRHTKNCLHQIDENDRINVGLLSTPVDFLTTLKNGEHIPMLTEIYHMQKEQLRNFTASVLGVDKNFFSNIPNQLHLLFGSIKYWLSNSTPKPSKEFLSALLLVILYYQIREIALQINKNQEGLLKNISQPNAVKIVEILNPYLRKPVTNQDNPFDVRIVHYYSQLQTCISESVILNLLMNLPFEPPKIYESLNGSMFYNLTKEFEMSSNSEAVIKSLLGGDSVAIRIFNTYMNKFVAKLPGDYFRWSFRGRPNRK